MIPKFSRKLPFVSRRIQAGIPEAPTGHAKDAGTRSETMPGKSSMLLRRRGGARQAMRLLYVGAALFSLANVPVAAQSARVAGELTTFSTSFTSAVADAVDASQNVYVLTSAGTVYKETFDSATGTYTESSLFTTASSSGSGIAVDSTGTNIYVGTGTGHTVAQYTGSGTSYSLANTFSGFTGATAPAVDAAENVYIADAAAGVLYKETLAGSTYSQASIAAGLTTPTSIAIDAAGTLFVNSGTTKIYKVSGSGTTYTKTNLGLNGLAGIAGIAVDGSDDLFVQITTGIVEQALSGGTYTGSPYYQYTGDAIALDSLGDLYLVSGTQSSGTKLTVGSGYLNFGSVGPGSPEPMTVAFTVTSSSNGMLGTPTVVTQGLTGYDFTLGSGDTCAGTAITAGNSCTTVVQFHPLASGSRLGAVNLVTSGGNTVASSFLGGDGFAPLAAYQSVTLLNTISSSLSSGRGITVDPAGNIFVANSTAAQILKFPPNSSTPVVFNTSSTCSPVGTAVDGEGNVFYTCNNETNMYELVGGSGTPVAIPVGYSTDDHLSVDSAGNLYPTSYSPGNYFLKVAAGTHTVTKIATAPTGARFVGAVTDAAGNTFAPDYNNDILYELPAGSNTLITLYSGAPLQAPHAIAEDAAGSLYVTSTTPSTAGAGSSDLFRFSAGNYTAAPATIAVPGGDSLFITPNGNFYTVYSNSTLAVYSRSLFSLTYPDTPVGQTSSSQTVVLENDGTAPLTISPPSSSTNPSISPNFNFDPSSTCPQLSSTSAPVMLAAGGSCTQILEFTPLQAGSNSGSMVTTDNSANVAGSTQTISLSGTATPGTPTVSVANASGTLGQPVTLTATVSGGGFAPDGAVTFAVGSGPSVNATCTAATSSETCTASYPTAAALSAGANTITATFAADANYVTASATGTLTLAAAPSTSAVVSSLNPSTFGAAVTLTGTVSSPYGTPTGSVAFLDGTTVLGTGTLSGGTASLTSSTLATGTHAITIAYGGAASFATSTSSIVNQVVNKATGFSDALTSSNTMPSFGSSVTFTDTIAVLGGVPATGTVTFYNGTTSIGTGTVNSSGIATLTITTLPVGTDKITATYGGDGNYTTSTAARVTETVSQASVVSSLATSNANPAFGSSITLTDTLPVLGGVAPTGKVTFYNGTTSLGTGTLNASGVATLSTSALPVGTDSVTAVSASDGNYLTSTSNAVTETVTKASGYSDVLATSNPSPVFGSSVTLTMTLGAVGGVYPTGSVTFFNGTTQIGTGTLSATGVAILTTNALPVGSDSITAGYGGDGNFSNSTSNIVAEAVAKVNVASDVLTTSNAAPNFGGSITLTDTFAAVNGAYPTGTVTFYNGTTAIGTGTISATGIATLTTSTLPVGSDSITAGYGGDSNFNLATSNKVTETVAKASVPTDVLTTSNATPGFGSSITLTDTLAAVNGTYPSGTVTFYNGTTAIGTGTLNATGVATLITSALPAGSDSITAGFGGDTNFNTATSNALTETVSKATGYGNVLSTSNASPSYGSSVTLTDTIAAVNGTYATGTVTFYNGATSIGTGTLSASGIATLSISSLPVGSDSITASYPGDTTFSNSTSNVVSEAVAKANVASNVLATSNASPAFGASVTLTDTLGPLGGTYPTGTVTFFNGATSLGTGTISATGVATLSTTALPVGTDSVTAVYPGDNTFSNSTSNAVTETVAKASGYSDVLTTFNATPSFGTPVTLTDTIAAVNGVFPTGSVTFYSGTTAIGTGTISATGVATLSTSNLPSGTDSITANYGGDSTFAPATSNAIVETVAKASGYGDVLATSNATPSYGNSVTLTDTLAAVNGTYPTGTVTFYNGTTAIGTGALSASGVATLTTITLPVGTDSISASYGGDTNFAAATSNKITETVGKASGYNDVLTTSNTSPVYGSSVTLTDTLAAVSGVYPTGSVTFYNGTTALGTGTVSASGVATLSISTLPVGTDSITAVYGGDSTFSGATSNAIVETVAKASVPSNVLTTSNASPAFGASVTLTDTLGGLPGTNPTGTVTFYNGAAVLGTGTISASGIATLTTTALPVGTDSVTAVYPGDNTFSNSTSNAATETVAKASVPTDVLTTSNANAGFGSSITLTDTLAAVNGTYPTGTVTFYNGTTAIGTGTISATGVATLTTSALPAGSDSITATYGGDSNFNNASSNALTETVAKATGYGNVLTTSNASPTYGTSVTLTDTLAAVNGTYPTGTVTFYNGATAIGTGALSASGVATLTTSTLPVGTDSISASYPGDTNFAAATSNKVTETVGKASGYGDVLTTSGTTPVYGSSVTLTDTLAAVNGVYQTGSVTFYNGATAIGTGTISASGVATLSTSALPAGADSITAVYGGDSTFTGTTSNAIVEMVAKASVPSDTLATSNANPAFGSSVTLTDTLAALSGTYPTGTVTFYSGTTALGTGTINATGLATFSTSTLPTGTDSLTAVYSGDSTFATATSNAVTETIAKASGTNTLTTSNASPVFGSNVTLTDTLSGVNGVTPTGTVTFYNGTAVLGTGTVNSSAVATLTSGTLPVGTDTITAVYSGDTNYSGLTSNAVTETVSKATINPDVLTSAPTAPSFGQSVTLTDTLTAVNGTGPTGTVTFYNGTSVLGTGTVNGSGLATLSTASLPTGSNTISAVYGGDQNYNNITSNLLTVTVGKIAATSNDTASGSGIYAAASTPVTVTIPYSGPTAPTGAITVTDTHGNTATIQASGCTAAASVLTCTGNLPTANEPAGPNPVTVNQAADTNYAGSTGTGTVTIGKAPASTGDTATGTGAYGAPTTPVTVTIPYAGATAPTGPVTVTDTYTNTVSVAASTCIAAGSTLTCTVNLPTATEPVGRNSVSVSQAADSNYSGSTGTGSVTIGKAPVTSNDAATGTGTYGAPTTTVQVSIPYAGTTAPTGAITISDNLGNTVTIQASSCTSSGGALSCTANLSTANEPLGSNAITISQVSDANYSGSTGTGTITIKPAGSRNDDSANGTGSYGAPSTPMTVIISFTGSTSPTGAITVADMLGNAVTIPASTCNVSGNALVCPASLQTANEPVGTNPVTVAQAADASHLSTTGSGSIVINKAATTTSDTATGAGTYGAATTPVSVSIPYVGAAAPTGAVAVTDSLGNTASVQGTLCSTANQTLTCSVNLPTANEPVGANSVTIAQAADANYSGSTGTGTVTMSTATVGPLGNTAAGVQNVTVTQGTTSTLLTATLAYSGSIAPTGAVTFTVAGGSPIPATCTSGASPEFCTATYSTSSLAVGTYVITATEAADANYVAGSATGTLTVESGAVSPILDTISNVGNVLITAGTTSAPLTASITFNGPVPTGALTFNLPGGTPVTATCTTGTSPLTCTANYPTASLAAGTYVISAMEAADGTYPQGSATALLTIQPNGAPPASPVLTTGSNVSSVLIPYGTTSTNLLATIAYTGPVPTGAVTFSVVGGAGGTVAATCSTGSSPLSCAAVYQTASLGVGSYLIQVNEAADANYPAGSATGTLTVTNVAAGTNDLVTGTGTYGSSTTPVTVTIPYVGTVVPTGIITITDSQGNTVTAPASSCTASSGLLTCTANLPTANVPAGSDAATVGQAADAYYAASTGSGTITINKAPATTGDTAMGTGTYGAATTPVTVTIPYLGAVAPTGAITVSDTHGNTVSVPASSCTAANAMLTCTANLPTGNEPVGPNAVTVTQGADTNYAASTGSGTITINKAPATTTDTATGTGTYGASTTPVTVTIPYAGSAFPTGAITLSDTLGETATVQASSCSTAGGTLTCTINLPTANELVGANAVTVSQAGDINYSGSTGSGVVTMSKAGGGADTASATGTYGTATTPVTITIPFSGSAPTGTITLADTHGNTITVPTSSCTAANGTLTCTASLSTANDPVGPNPVTVTQAADANHSASSGSGTVTINKAPPTNTDTATGTGTFGSATIPVTVTIPYAGPTAPTGAITITDSVGETVTIQASACTAVNGILTCTASLPTANEPLGSNQLTIAQAADANYDGSTGSGTITISKAGATGNDTATGTGTYGTQTTLASVTIPYSGSTVPTGAISLTDTHGNTVTIQSAACTAAKGTLTCSVSLPTANEPVGTNTVTVTQAADAVTSGSTGTGSITISKAPSTTNDTVTGTATYGAATTAVTVTIPFAGATAPTGAITITDTQGNTVTVQAANCTVAKGVLTCTTNLPTANEPAGTNSITVTQAADANYNGSTGSGSITIEKATPTLTAPTVSPLNAVANTAVTLSETVPAGETGTVTFSSGTTVLGTATIANGVATLTTSALPQGTDLITATASGDSNYSAATSPATADAVGVGSMKIALTSSQNTSILGSSVTFTSTVSTTPATALAGKVTFYDGTTALGTTTLNNGVALLSTSSLTVGVHTITATFTPASGSALTAVTSSAITLTVQQPASSIALTSSLNPAIVGQSVTFSATVPTATSGTAATGMVTFYDGTTVLGTTPMNGSGVANFVISSLSGGMHSVTAAYAGDSNYSPSTSGAVAQQVSDYTVGSTTPTLTVAAGQPAAFNITINPLKGVGFAAPVVMTVTGLPANFTAVFGPGTLTPGSSGTTSTLMVQTVAPILTAMEHKQHVRTLETAALWACVFPLLGLGGIRRRLPKALLMLAVCLVSLGVIAPLTGCGGGYFGSAPASYTLTVTGTSGTLQRSTTVTLNVH